MSKNEVTDLITDQEIAFALLILAGSMTDQQAAAAVGLDPNTAAYIKSKPCVRAYMLEHRDRMQQQLVQQETEVLPCFHVGREQVLDRLWELASLGPEVTRGSITGQVKAMSMIVAIEGLIPDRRAGSAEKNPAPSPSKAQIYQSKWFREQQGETAGPNPALDQQDQQEDGLICPQAEPALGSAEDMPADDPGEATFAIPVSLLETQSAPHAAFAPDTRVPFSIKKNPFARRRF
jgi:hypothetical protein